MTDQALDGGAEQPADAVPAPPPGSEEQPVTGAAPPAPGATGEGVRDEQAWSDPAGTRGLLGDSAGFSQRWDAIQATFVDEPRQAVERADALVREVIEQLARVFGDERQRLEAAWSGGSQVSTEDLRQTLQRYRDFFQALVRS